MGSVDHGAMLPCKGCGETKYLVPDPAGYYCDSKCEDGAPLLCRNPDCSRNPNPEGMRARVALEAVDALAFVQIDPPRRVGNQYQYSECLGLVVEKCHDGRLYYWYEGEYISRAEAYVLLRAAIGKLNGRG